MSDKEPEPQKPLDDKQVKLAKELIKELHPINNTHYDVSFPFMCFIPGQLWRMCFIDNCADPKIEKNINEPLMDDTEQPVDDSPEAKKILKMKEKKAKGAIRKSMIKEKS